MSETMKWILGIGLVSTFWTVAAVGLELAAGHLDSEDAVHVSPVLHQEMRSD